MENIPKNDSSPQLRPAIVPQKPEPEQTELARPNLSPNVRTNLRNTPEDRVRHALGLSSTDPLPEPKTLSPQMQQALAQLDPDLSHQVLAVIGALQHLGEKAQATGDAVQTKMAGSIEKTRQVSFAQRTVIRRAHQGTLNDQDIERARGLIAVSGSKGAVDTKDAGLDELIFQRNEMTGAAHDMQHILLQHQPNSPNEMASALSFVEHTIGQQTAQTSLLIDDTWQSYQSSDLERIALIVESQDKLRMEGSTLHRNTMG